MFSPQIIDSDAFLDMPSSAQNLYFHFGMRADDDGFVDNPKKILRMVSGNEDDYKLLLLKRFVLPFESGIIVIKHWRINNYIRKDIYEPTKYVEEKRQLLIKKNGAYTFSKDEGVPLPEGHFVLEDIEKITCTQRALPVPLGKDRKGKDRKEKNTYTADFEEFWKIYPKHVGKPKASELWAKLTDEEKVKVMEDIPKRKAEDDKWVNGFVKDPERYIKYKQWEDEIIKPRGQVVPQRRVDNFATK